MAGDQSVLHLTGTRYRSKCRHHRLRFDPKWMYWWRSRKRRDQTRGCRLYLRKSAEKVRKDPTKSVVYDQYEEDREKYLNDADFNKPANFTW